MNRFEQDMFYELESENIELKRINLNNPFEKACREFLKSCSCAAKDEPQGCPECTTAFVQHIQKLVREGEDA